MNWFKFSGEYQDRRGQELEPLRQSSGSAGGLSSEARRQEEIQLIGDWTGLRGGLRGQPPLSTGPPQDGELWEYSRWEFLFKLDGLDGLDL